MNDAPTLPLLLKPDEVLTVGDVAERYKVPVSWVYERTRRKGKDRLPHHKLGKYLRFRGSDIERYFQEQRRD